MGYPDHGNHIIELMRRTQLNLYYANDPDIHKDAPSKRFEITQLFNSMLGLIIIPVAFLQPELKEITLGDAYKDGFPRITNTIEALEESRKLDFVMNHIRNGFAHGHLQMQGTRDSNMKPVLESIRVWDRPIIVKRKLRTFGDVNFDTVLSVEDIRQIIEYFSAHINTERLECVDKWCPEAEIRNSDFRGCE